MGRCAVACSSQNGRVSENGSKDGNEDGDENNGEGSDKDGDKNSSVGGDEIGDKKKSQQELNGMLTMMGMGISMRMVLTMSDMLNGDN